MSVKLIRDNKAYIQLRDIFNIQICSNPIPSEVTEILLEILKIEGKTDLRGIACMNVSKSIIGREDEFVVFSSLESIEFISGLSKVLDFEEFCSLSEEQIEKEIEMLDGRRKKLEGQWSEEIVKADFSISVVRTPEEKEVLFNISNRIWELTYALEAKRKNLQIGPTEVQRKRDYSNN